MMLRTAGKLLEQATKVYFTIAKSSKGKAKTFFESKLVDFDSSVKSFINKGVQDKSLAG